MAISLTIDGAQVALKKGSSIEYVSENRIFTDADDYSLEIELPVGYFSHARQCPSKLALHSLNRKSAECPQNIAVFGHLTRKDIDTDKIFFDAVRRTPSFVRLVPWSSQASPTKTSRCSSSKRGRIRTSFRTSMRPTLTS